MRSGNVLDNVQNQIRFLEERHYLEEYIPKNTIFMLLPNNIGGIFKGQKCPHIAYKIPNSGYDIVNKQLLLLQIINPL